VGIEPVDVPQPAEVKTEDLLQLRHKLLAVKLSKTLIAEPPLELWPEVVTRVAVPEDVTERVIRPLSQDN
jgi:hypothetical protein